MKYIDIRLPLGDPIDLSDEVIEHYKTIHVNNDKIVLACADYLISFYATREQVRKEQTGNEKIEVDYGDRMRNMQMIRSRLLRTTIPVHFGGHNHKSILVFGDGYTVEPWNCKP